jgi:integrase
LGNLYLDEISRDILDQIIDAKLQTGVENATVNRIMEVLRTVLNSAVKQWEWLEKAPHVRMLPEPQRRIRWLTKAEARRLRVKLKPHMRDMMEFSLATGLRESNVTKLEWSQVDLDRKVAWIHADQSKSRKPIGIPLNSDALRILIAQRGKHPKRVFTYYGKPVDSANTRAWRQALKDAGIEDFRWHDLRHTWASWHVQNGTRLEVLKELGGWSDLKTVLKYAHLAPEHLAQDAENICDKDTMKNNVAHFPAHNTKRDRRTANKGA